MEKTGMSSANLTGESHDEDPAVSMIDVLREEEELEADANAVLGDSDATNCTYLMVGFCLHLTYTGSVQITKIKTKRNMVLRNCCAIFMTLAKFI